MAQLLLLLLLCFVAPPSLPTHLPPTTTVPHKVPQEATRHTRATFSRPPASDAAQERLYGYDCLARPDKTQVFSMGQTRARCKRPSNPTPHHLEHKVFDVFQYQRVEEVTLLSCEISISRFVGTCGMFDHWAWDSPPQISVSQSLSTRECTQLHEERVLHWSGQKYPIKMGANAISAIEAGSLRYDAQGATVVCTGNEARLEREGSQVVEAALVMEHLKVTLTREKGEKLLSDPRTLVITSGSHHGVEWSRHEVDKGGAQLGTVTFVLEASHLNQAPKCPLALLRNQVKMTRVSRSSSSSPLRDPAAVNLSDPMLQVTAVVWTNSQLAVHQLDPVSLPATCGTGLFYKTNHNNILLSENTSPEAMSSIKNNALNYLTLSNLADSSRNDLVHFHVEELFANLTEQIEDLQCVGTLEQMYNSEPASGDQVKVRYVEAGEVVFRLLCPRVEILPGRGPEAAGGEQVCTKQIPVHTQSSSTHQVMYLEAGSRYLMTSSKILPCSVHQLAPTVYEANSGNFIYFNGSKVLYLNAEVKQTLDLQRKFSRIELFDINKDVDLTGLESAQQLEQSSLFMEYNRFLEVDQRQDLDGSPSVQHARTSGGQSVHSWWLQSHGMASDLSQEALAVVGFSWITKVWRFVTETLASLRPLATIGGMIYFIRIIVSILSKIFRLMLVLYTRPGQPLRKSIRLSVSGRSRREEIMEEQMSRLIDQRVTASLGTELAVMRAKSRQEE